MRRLQLGLIILGLQTATAGAQSATFGGDAVIDVTIGGEPVASVDVFYDQLSPYGIWLEDPNLGRVFVSEDPNYVPYTAGHWEYSNVGFVWVSNEPFAWATAHYGRWAFSPEFGRWVWRPDTVWGPSWVEWREEGDYFGWAPMAPDGYGYAPPIESWHYCNASFILDANVSRHYEPRTRVVEIHRAARPVEHYARVAGARVVVGPSETVLRQHRVRAVPRQIDVRAIGRLSAAESTAAVKRAHERKATIEESNRKRLEANAALRVKQAEVKRNPRKPTPQVRQEPKPQPKEQPRPQAQPEPKREPKAEPKRAEPRPEPKRVGPEPKRAEPRPEAKRVEPEPKRAEPRPEAKRVEPEPKRAEPRPEAKRVEPKPEPKRVEPKPEPKRAEPRPEPKREERPQQPRPESKARPEPKSPKPEKKKSDDDRKHDKS